MPYIFNVFHNFLYIVTRFHRANQAFIFPIHLSQDIVPNAIFYGTIAPLAVFWLVKVTVIDPYLKKEKEK